MTDAEFGALLRRLGALLAAGKLSDEPLTDEELGLTGDEEEDEEEDDDDDEEEEANEHRPQGQRFLRRRCQPRPVVQRRRARWRRARERSE